MSNAAPGAWVIGHNLSGFLPESDTFAFEDREEAEESLRDVMRDYAASDDEMHDWTAMSETVEAVLESSGPERMTGDWATYVADGQDRAISFWLEWSNDRTPGDNDD